MKKSEKLSQAIGGLNEDIIEKADRRRSAEKSKKAKKFPLKLTATIAASLAAVIGITALFPRNASALALAEADYPIATKYPAEVDSNFEKWGEEIHARLERGELIPSSVNNFYKKTAEEFLSGDENRAYSPVNIYMALAMLGEATDGESRRQILDLLGASNIDQLREDANNMWLANYRNDGATTSILANSVWLNEGVNVKQQTVDTLAENYYTSSYSGDVSSRKMTDALREWLNRQTGGLLSNAVKNVELDPETIMALYSTVYFCAKWDREFSESENDNKTFHTLNGDVQTEFMNGTYTVGSYYGGEYFNAIHLNFKERGSMWFILPDKDKTVNDVLSSGEYVEMISNSWEWKNRKEMKINYSVPKFDISSQIRLSEGLINLGVRDIFNEKADFSPLTDNSVVISEANHAARVTIDEEGCTAAAFTELQLAGGLELPPEDEIDFILDRPFIFAVMSDTEQPLFIGTVSDPKK